MFSTLKRTHSGVAKELGKQRRDRKKRQKVEERRGVEMLPVHGGKYVKPYLYPDVVIRLFDVLEYKAVSGCDMGKNKRKSGRTKCPASLLVCSLSFV